MKTNWYPLLFEPILKERIWGGIKLHTLLNKPIPSQHTGESWEISTVKGDISIITNGNYKDSDLTQLIHSYPEEILGRKVYQQFGTQFPLLFKFLDAQEDLSIQLHPNDELAQKRHNSFGKTEMWYVMQADPEARIIVGFQQDSSAKEYLANLENKTLPTILNEITVKKGDVFLLKTGTIHAIGAGIVIAEIQQTSDITYRVYDWDRLDSKGNSRELHLDLAMEAINYKVQNAKKEYQSKINTSNSVIQCDYFTTNIIPLNGNVHYINNHDSFVVFMCTEGSFEITSSNIKCIINVGQTVLLPAALTEFEIKGSATILEIYL